MSQLVRLEGKHSSQNAHCALFTLKLDFKVNSFVSSKGPFGKIQVTDIALFGFMDFCHVLSQDVCSVESLFTASAL